jgi:hypothetical protein
MAAQIDFLIAGTQKAGTSSLKAYLGQHPRLLMHAQEEITCFVVAEEDSCDPRRILDQYYPDRSSAGTQLLAGKSAGVMYSEEALARVAAHNPQMKLLVLLRNPVERAYSAYWFLRRKGREPLSSFAEALAAEEFRLATGGPLAWFCSYRDRGLYARQLENIYRHFPQDQVRVELFDDLKTAPGLICRQVFGWLGIDGDFEPDCQASFNPAGRARSDRFARLLVANSGPVQLLKRVLPKSLGRAFKQRLQQMNEAEFRPEPMAEEQRRELVEFFRQPNQALGQLIGRSLDHWNR